MISGMTADQFNRDYYIGTPVYAYPDGPDGRFIETHTEEEAQGVGSDTFIRVEGVKGPIKLLWVEIR